MTRLVLGTSDIQRQLNRTFRTEVVTRAVLLAQTSKILITTFSVIPYLRAVKGMFMTVTIMRC